MALAYVGSLSLPALVPVVELSIGAPAIAINAQLQGAISLNASLTVSPPTVAVYLATLAEIEAQLTAAIDLGLPSVSFQFSDTVTLIASLEAAFGILAQLEALLTASIGVYAFVYSGTASAMGAAVTAELASAFPDGAPSSAATQAMILGAVSPASQSVIVGFLNGLQVGAGLVYTAKLSALATLSVVTALAVGQGEPAIQAQLDAALAVQAHVQVSPPTLAVTLEAVASFAAYLRANIAVGPPSVHAAISATASLVASIQAHFGMLVQLGALLSSAGSVFAYTYSGAGSALGVALTSALASTWGDGVTPTSSACVVPILATTDAASWTTLSAFFGGLRP